MTEIKRIHSSKIKLDFYDNKLQGIEARLTSDAVTQGTSCVQIFNNSIGYLEITIRRGQTRATSKLNYFKLLCFLSPSWHLWRHYCRKFEREKRKRNKWTKRMNKRIGNQEFEQAMIEVFPHIMEKELLGDNYVD